MDLLPCPDKKLKRLARPYLVLFSLLGSPDIKTGIRQGLPLLLFYREDWEDRTEWKSLLAWLGGQRSVLQHLLGSDRTE